MLVCNYGGRDAGGNIISRPVYISGEPCTKCLGWECNSKWDGLCGNDIKIDKTINQTKTTTENNDLPNDLPFRNRRPTNTGKIY